MIEKPLIIFFIGRSGSGKGTQFKLLKEYLEKVDTRSVFVFEMGKAFRDFLLKEESQNNLGASIGKKLYDTGKLMPNFITAAFFVNGILQNLEKDQHLFADAYPRSLEQLSELNKLIEYYGFTGCIVLDIDVPEDEVRKRMLARGRRDDTEIGIQNRFEFYKTDVIPVLEKIKEDAHYRYVHVDGTPAPEIIHEDIKNKLGI
jgi:adenylate kinase